MAVKVSVIVAVYNPGHHIDELLESLDAQSLPQEEFEVLLCDDDSTDGTRERLQEWAATRPHATVIHNTPNSGWPGRPRNLGIDAATGEYLFFADNDDRLAEHALEWLYDYAKAHGSDAVIPKMVGIGPGRGVPRRLFDRSRPKVVLGQDAFLGILTPHKLFRRSIVVEEKIRFPEGRDVRLEDHFFVMSFYFAAKTISVYADNVCYYWMRRDDGENATYRPTDPKIYYDSVARTLDVVRRNTEPGPLRDKLYAHWYEGKMLKRLRGNFLDRDLEHQERVFEQIRKVVTEFDLGSRQEQWLGVSSRVLSALVGAGDLDRVKEFVTAERGITMRAKLTGITWWEGTLRLTLTAVLVYRDGSPVRIRKDGERVFWCLSGRLEGSDVDDVEVTDHFPRARVDVITRERDTMSMTYLPVESTPFTNDTISMLGEAVFDPAKVFQSRPSPAFSDLLIRITALGWWAEMRLPAGDFAQALPAVGSRQIDRKSVV